jgi:hypothetical protein
MMKDSTGVINLKKQEESASKINMKELTKNIIQASEAVTVSVS